MPFGTVTDTKPGFVKVYLEAYELQLDWIPLVSPHTYKNKAQFNLNIGSQVFVVQERDKFGEIENVCIGATYNEEDAPPFDSIAKHGFKLPNSETLILHGEDTNAVRYAELKAVLDSMISTYNALIKAYNTHVHVSASPGNPSAVPSTVYTKTVTDNTASIKSDVVKLD